MKCEGRPGEEKKLNCCVRSGGGVVQGGEDGETGIKQNIFLLLRGGCGVEYRKDTAGKNILMPWEGRRVGGKTMKAEETKEVF